MSPEHPDTPPTLEYGRPDPRPERRGKYIVIAVLGFMTLSWVYNLGEAVSRGRLSVGMGLQFVVCLWLMIWLWRGAAWARWVTFAFYTYFGVWLLLYAAASRSLYFAACATSLCLLCVGLAMPSVGRFQRSQLRSGT